MGVRVDRAMVPDDKRTGVFLHTTDETKPYVVGALWLDGARGVTAEVPYLTGVLGQFETAREWFTRAVPANMLFRSHTLHGTLFGCHRTRWAERGFVSIGGFRATEMVLAERVGSIDDPLEVSVFTSRIDGLSDWTRLSSVDWTGEDVPGDGSPRRRITYTLEQSDGLSWLQGGARMTLTTDWNPVDGAPADGIHMDDAVVLKSKFRTPRPIADHLSEHWKFRSFLQMTYGVAASFRGHRVRDYRFPDLSLGGSVHGVETRAIICSATVDEEHRPPLGAHELDWPIVRIDDLDERVLSAWSANYESWKRIILPTSGVLRRSGLFAEDKVINASMSIEAIGDLLAATDGEEATYGKKTKRPTAATDYYRAMKFVGVSGDAVAEDLSHLAWALANTYNRTKHADRGDFPEPLHSVGAGRITLMLVRLVLLKMLMPESPAIARFVDGWAFRKMMKDLKDRGLRADASGEFVTKS